MASYIIRVKTATGSIENEIVDGKRLLTKLIDRLSENLRGLLKYIDPYGDTVFNSIQMPDFIAACEKLTGPDATPDEREFVERLIGLAELTKACTGRFLVFIGD